MINNHFFQNLGFVLLGGGMNVPPLDDEITNGSNHGKPLGWSTVNG